MLKKRVSVDAKKRQQWRRRRRQRQRRKKGSAVTASTAAALKTSTVKKIWWSDAKWKRKHCLTWTGLKTEAQKWFWTPTVLAASRNQGPVLQNKENSSGVLDRNPIRELPIESYEAKGLNDKCCTDIILVTVVYSFSLSSSWISVISKLSSLEPAALKLIQCQRTQNPSRLE